MHQTNIRKLSESDQAEFASFRCVTPDRPWTLEYEQGIRTELATALATGYMHGNGYWLEGRLVGINSWCVERDLIIVARFGKVWRSSLLAVAVGYRGCRIGLALKQQLVIEARNAGVKAITSMVRWDNVAMLQLNGKLNGSVIAIPRDDGPDAIHCWSVVPVT